MTVELWDGEVPVLADTSAWMIARQQPRARELLLAAVGRGDVAWCWPVRYELIVDARGSEEIGIVDRTLEGLREIAVDRSVQRGVLTVMRELADEGSHGAQRLPLTDLTVAVAAQHAGLDVLHYDRHLERLAGLVHARMLWISNPRPDGDRANDQSQPKADPPTLEES